ncbi:MAG: RdgB/HAM1 family non-canonical purine NTP pyrophosphatase [Candidatus Cybelea sp.]
MKTFVATQNAGKLRELRAIFSGSPLTLAKPRKYTAVVEDADTYAGNALLKAQALAATLQKRGIEGIVLADDSGLEVDALEGRPGVYSARYGGADIGWPERRAALLEELRGVPPYRRSARFVCALALIEPGREPIAVTGHVNGYLLEVESGTGGFGYDPLFFHPPSGLSFASLSEKEKNAVSHRRRAADALLAALRGRV